MCEECLASPKIILHQSLQWRTMDLNNGFSGLT